MWHRRRQHQAGRTDEQEAPAAGETRRRNAHAAPTPRGECHPGALCGQTRRIRVSGDAFEQGNACTPGATRERASAIDGERGARHSTGSAEAAGAMQTRMQVA